MLDEYLVTRPYEHRHRDEVRHGSPGSRHHTFGRHTAIPGNCLLQGFVAIQAGTGNLQFVEMRSELSRRTRQDAAGCEVELRRRTCLRPSEVFGSQCIVHGSWTV